MAVPPDRVFDVLADGWSYRELEPAGDGRALGRMRERADNGPGALVPGALQDVLLVPRDREALQRLRAVAEHRER
jgi:hypothetical protein